MSEPTKIEESKNWCVRDAEGRIKESGLTESEAKAKEQQLGEGVEAKQVLLG